MATSGLSLVGFMEQGYALQYLRTRCILVDTSEDSLLGHWEQASRRLGPPVIGAGYPDIRDLPASSFPYLQRVMANPRFAETVNDLSWSFKMVEIDKILAFQYDVDLDHSADVCSGLQPNSPIDDVLRLCLPVDVEQISFRVAGHPNGITVQSRSLNLRPRGFGMLGEDGVQRVHVAGLAFGPSSPLVQVVRFGGRCYLKNGFHRAYGTRLAGQTHLPCVFLEATNPEDIGISPPVTFSLEALTNENPPTCGHFTSERAYPVTLRQFMRVIHVNYSDDVLPIDG